MCNLVMKAGTAYRREVWTVKGRGWTLEGRDGLGLGVGWGAWTLDP
jgi:hypothetical protein